MSRASPSEVDRLEQAVLAAYQGYWRAYQVANDPPSLFHPDLRRYATDEVYAATFRATQVNQLSGRALRRPSHSRTVHRAEVVSLAPGRAVVRDCAVDDLLVVEIATGAVLDDRVVSRRGIATLVLEDGLWKVARTSVEQRWEGVGGCALG